MNNQKASLKRVITMPPSKPGLSSANKSAQCAGGVDEDIFLKAFDDTTMVNFQSLKEAEREFRSICSILNNSNLDWQRRIDALRHFRGLINAGLMEYKEIVDIFKLCELPFQVCVKDLRSQVVREAAITIAFISFKLGLKCARFCEALMPTLFSLIPNSAKIMSSSALVCIKLMIQNTKSARLIPIVVANLSSKSKEIRKASCEFLDLIVHTWSTHSLEKHTQQLAGAIKRGMSDADAEARQSARRAFWGFAEHFKVQSESLLNSLDPSKQKALFSQHPSVSNSSSTNSLIQSDSGHFPHQPRYTYNSTRSMSFSSSSSVENLDRPYCSLSSMNRNRSGIPIYISPKVDPVPSSTPYSLRSTSAIDVSAARRARARAAIAVTNARPNYVSGDHLSKLCKLKIATATPTRPNNNINKVHQQGSQQLFTEKSSMSLSGHLPEIESEPPGIDNITLVLSSLKSNAKDIQFQKYALNELIELIRESASQKWDKNFNDTLKILLDKISGDPNSNIRALSLKVMCELLVHQTHYFLDYIELTILRILEASKDPEKEVQNASTSAASTAAAVLPSEQCLKVLKSVITVGEFPMNQAAIKMLLKMIEKQPQETIEHLLPEMMPPLLQAYDNPESAVRKAAVFCMVGVHGRVGERMKPYLNGLSGSKMKLLDLYIDRAKSQSSGSNSPFNSKYDMKK